jgi:acyl-coenzyme A synthetase/AMP-(fatty) acid ligase
VLSLNVSIFNHFIAWVDKDPRRPAVTTLEQTWTYQELYDKSTQISYNLSNILNNQTQRIVILGHKSNNSVAGILGVLFSGCAYCPIDNTLPPERLNQILSMLSPYGLILTGLTFALRQALKELKQFPLFILDLEGDLTNTIMTSVPRIELTSGNYIFSPDADSPAYIIFTSGSTGKPKGVVMSHGAVNAALSMFQEHIGVIDSDRICNQVALCFDLSVFDIFGTLREGAHLYIAPANLSAAPERLLNYIKNKRITSLFTVPSTLNYILEYAGDNFGAEPLKKILFSGEPLTEELIHKIHIHARREIDIWNLYGATEMPYVLAEHINLNKKNAQFFSLRGLGIDLKISSGDELWVKSPALLSGYYVSPTASLIDPLRESCWYPTGDRASIDSEGNVTLFGRKDRQVKIQGHRIGLDEIESVLEKMEEIKEAAVIYLPEVLTLVAFVVLKKEIRKIENVSEIEHYCQTWLPLVMCPQVINVINEIPKTVSGKKDRKTLREGYNDIIEIKGFTL